MANTYLKAIDKGTKPEEVMTEIFKVFKGWLASDESKSSTIKEEVEAVLEMIEITDDDQPEPVVFINSESDMDDGSLS